MSAQVPVNPLLGPSMSGKNQTFAARLQELRLAHEQQLLRYQAALALRPAGGALSAIYSMTEHLLMIELSEGKILAEAQAILDSGEPDAEALAMLHWCTHGPAAQGLPHPSSVGQETLH